VERLSVDLAGPDRPARELGLSLYRDDLAYIHDAGFGHLAASAGSAVIAELQRAGADGGTVVDLGCGSGIASRSFRDAGYAVVGLDVSAPLIEMARRRVPDGDFRIGSYATADLPPCVAVTAIGEVFNYGCDAANSAAGRARVFARIFVALAPGGLLVFDIAGPGRAPSSGPQRTFVEGPDWTVLVEADAADSVLTRRITTFRKLEELYRRDLEIHRLRLIDPAEVVASLQGAGFAVRTLDAYGAAALPPGVVGFLACKPRSGSPG
jgi:SAM-dependent methyltransferase